MVSCSSAFVDELLIKICNYKTKYKLLTTCPFCDLFFHAYFFLSHYFCLFAILGLDVNECATGQQECSEFARCVNTIGSHSCFCLSGFTGDGKNCSGKYQFMTNICCTIVCCSSISGLNCVFLVAPFGGLFS